MIRPLFSIVLVVGMLSAVNHAKTISGPSPRATPPALSWTPQGKEASLTMNQTTKKNSKTPIPTVTLRIELDFKHGSNPKYPLGWPGANASLKSAITLNAYQLIEGEIRLSLGDTRDASAQVDNTGYADEARIPMPAIKLLLTSESHGSSQPRSLPVKRDQWVAFSIPLKKLKFKKSDSRQPIHVKSVHFYIHEKWYQKAGFKSGEVLRFAIRNLVFKKENHPRIDTLAVMPINLNSSNPRLHLNFSARGPWRQPRYRWQVQIFAQRQTSPVQTIPIHPDEVKNNTFSCDIPASQFTTGWYRLKLQLISGNQEITLRETIFRRLKNKTVSPYLMLFTFNTHALADGSMNLDAWIAKCNSLCYDGIAGWFFDIANHYPKPAWESLVPLLDKLKQGLKKDLWLTSYFTRFIEFDPKKSHKGHYAGLQSDTQAIRGMDLDNETGALQIFLDEFSLLLRSAKYLDAPGIVIDHEAYGNYPMYDLHTLAQRRGETDEQTRDKLLKIGQRMGEIVQNNYPEAVLWILGLKQPRTVTLINEGLLRYAHAHKLPCRIVDGGENTLNYINPDLNLLKEKMLDRQTRIFHHWLMTYPENFFLGGTIAPTDRPDSRKNWVLKQYQKGKIQTVDDLKPHLTTILKTYQYVWIYAASAANFFPFEDSEQSRRFEKMIYHALTTVRPGHSENPHPSSP